MAYVFKNQDVLLEIKRTDLNKKDDDIKDLVEWLATPPKYTTIRINKLRQFNTTYLTAFLESQLQELDAKEIPKFKMLSSDCLILESWLDQAEIKKSETEVIVDASCAAAVLRGAHVYAPGVMGLPSNCKIEDIVDIYGDLDGNCKKGLKVPYEGRKLFVGTGKLKMLRHHLFNDNDPARGIAVHTLLPVSKVPVVNESLYPKGDILLQNLPSIVCGWVMDVKPGEVVLDMCAAPGNKTTHLAEMSNDLAKIIAIDKTQQKVDRVKMNAEAHGITSIAAYVYDSTKCYSENSKGIDNGPPFPENSFDKILLDAPCSGLGQRPQLLNKITPKILSSYKFVQRKLIAGAVKILKQGGQLVYSTCTVTADENERLVAWALKEFPCLELVPADPLCGGEGWAHCGLTDEERILTQRFGPEGREDSETIYKDSIGFFIACFRKRNI